MSSPIWHSIYLARLMPTLALFREHRRDSVMTRINCRIAYSAWGVVDPVLETESRLIHDIWGPR